MACTKGNQLLEGDLHDILDKIEADILQLQRNRTENGSSNIKDPSTERPQLQMAVLHQSMCISKAGLSILRYIQAEYKDKKPDANSSYQNLKICVSKVQKK